MKRIFKNTIRIFVTMLLIATFTSCGGASSAPPVDLPAPITGRVTISNPDSSGNVTITGTAGAVDAGAMVMAVNEETAGTVSAMILNMLVKSAYAETSFPVLCDEEGYSCAVADDDGAFEMTLAAAFGDSIVIGIIDEDTGEFISEIIRRAVGEAVETLACADYDVNGAVVDIVIDPITGEPILLRRGSSTTSNQIIVGESSPITIPIGGCFAHSITARTEASGKTLILVSSKDDKKVWRGDLFENKISSSQTIDSVGAPLDLELPPSSTDTLIGTSLNEAGLISIDLVSISDISNINYMDVSLKNGEELTPITDLAETLDLKIIGMSGGRDLAALLARTDSADEAYLTLFDVDSLKTLATITPDDFEHLAGLTEVTSIALYIDIEGFIAIAFVDSENNRLWITYLQQANNTLSYNTDLSDESIFKVNWTLRVTSDHYFELYDGNDIYPITRLAMTDMEVTTSKTSYIAGSTSDGRLWLGTAIAVFEVGTNTGEIYDVEPGNNLIGIAIDSDLESAFVADSTNETAISVSERTWP
jgi:hypothetical protein